MGEQFLESFAVTTSPANIITKLDYVMSPILYIIRGTF